MNPKAEIFFDAITLLPEDIVEEAQDYRFRRKPAVWKKVGSLAACLMLIVSLTMLAAVPRGCGASGGNSSAPMANGSADTCAPADMPGESAPSYQGAPPTSTEPAPEPGAAPSGEAGNGLYGVGQRQFIAIVIEVQEDAILVGSLEGDAEAQLLIPTEGLVVPELAEGDMVRVTCGDNSYVVWATSPAEVLEVQAIEKIEE